MKHIGIILTVIMTIVLQSVAAFAQDYSLKGRSALELNMGFWGGSNTSNTITTNGIRSEAKTNGFLGGILYSHWIQEQVSATLSIGFLAGEATSTVSFSGINQHASIIVPVLIGVNYYLFNPAQEDAVRPFVSAAIGPYIGSETNNTILSQYAHSETAFGARFGAGIDILLGDHFKLGASAGYNVMSDFKNTVGAKSNYNGMDVLIGIGYIF
jgi:Outer membrane protein beta-barrel domain